MKDRRQGKERRVSRRFAITIDVEWEGLVGRQQGTISDVSMLGCFVLCSGEVENGETVKIFFPIGDGMKVQFWGEVVNHVYEIGFGVRFIEQNDSQIEFLEKLIGSIPKTV
ncbi:MAG: PilZ domain-containing protein [Pyrinomonadaceae bacterium]|nr:PilZ domain-containing protein [Pyrinomonadaceae bacterium]